MLKRVLWVTTIVLLLVGCDPGVIEEDEPVPIEESSLIVKNMPAGTPVIPKTFSFEIDYQVADEEVNETDTYLIVADFITGAVDGDNRIGTTEVPGQSGTVQLDITVSMDDLLVLTADLTAPYQVEITLLDESGPSPVELACSGPILYVEGIFTGNYDQWLHYYAGDSWNHFSMDLVQFDNEIIGTMTRLDSSNQPTSDVVDVSAVVNNDTLDTSISGLGQIVGESGTTIYSAGIVSYGNSKHLECDGYTLTGDDTIRGTFHADKTGTAEVTGSIIIPGADIDTFNAINGNGMRVLLNFDPSLGENGNGRNEVKTWDITADGTMTFIIDNAPAGNYAVILVADCDDDDNPVGSGDCFGVAGLNASEALTVLGNLNTTSLDDLQTYTLTEGSTVTTAVIELALIP